MCLAPWGCPVLEYDFYSFQTGPVDVYTYMMPIFPLDNEHGSRYGVMVDNSPVYLPEAGRHIIALYGSRVLRNCRLTNYHSLINREAYRKIYCTPRDDVTKDSRYLEV